MVVRNVCIVLTSLTLALGSLLASTGASATTASKHGVHPAIHIVPPRGRLVTGPQGASIVYSSDSSGYVATPKSGHARAFSYVVASYTVPSLTCPSEGNGDIQMTALTPGISQFGYEDGVNSVCEPGGSVSYQGWYLTPDGGGAIEVNPGDAITSSVYYKAKTGVYTLKLTDATTGQGFDVTRNMPVQNTVAEVVTVGEGGTNDGMADFGAVHFDTIKVNDSVGQHGGLMNTNWTTDEVIALGFSSGQVEAQPGALYSASPPAQSAFGTTWLRGS